jgi:hypothetical protein
MWEDSHYYWVVVCKNHWFHLRQNLFYGHKIPLAEADAYSPPPPLKGSFAVRCDDCHKEYRYKPSDLLRHEQEPPESFIPHPLFRQDVMPGAGEMPGQPAIETVNGPERRRSQRLPLDVGLVVRGISLENAAFQEETFTISVSAHGALMPLSAKVALRQTLFLKNPRTQTEAEVRVARFGSPHDGLAQVEVGIEFARPAPMFWPIEAAPVSWKSVAK